MSMDHPELSLTTKKEMSLWYEKYHEFVKFRGDMKKNFENDFMNADLKLLQDLCICNYIFTHIPTGSKILEIGGGNSRILSFFKDKYEVWNLDKFEGLGNGPKIKSKDGTITTVHNYIGDFDNNIPKNYFDLVFSISVIEHINLTDNEHMNILNDIERILKPGGHSVHCIDCRFPVGNVTLSNRKFLKYILRHHGISESVILDNYENENIYYMSKIAYDKFWKKYCNNRPCEIDGLPFNIFFMAQKMSDPRCVQDNNAMNDNNEKIVETHRKETITGGLRCSGKSKKYLPNYPIVSIVTTVKNGVQNIERAIESVIKQTYANIEYIIIDALSTDGTLEIIEKYKDKIDLYVSEDDSGIYSGMNKGIRFAKGDYIIILNSDDYYEDIAIEKLVAAAIANPEDLIAAHAKVIDGNDKILRYAYTTFDDRIFSRCTVVHESLLVKREYYRVLGLYNEQFRIISDWNWLLKAYGRYSMTIVDMPLLCFTATGISSQVSKQHDDEKIHLISEAIHGFDDKDIEALRYPHHLKAEDIIFFANKYNDSVLFVRAMNIFYGIKTNQIDEKYTHVTVKNYLTPYVKEKKLKIVFVVWALLWNKGGIERVGVNLANEMDRRGHTSIIICTARGKKPVYKINDNVKVIPLEFQDNAESIRSVRDCLRTIDPDVCVPMFSWKDLLWWPVVLNETGIPMLVSEHNNPEIIESSRWNRKERIACMEAADAIHLLCDAYIPSIPDNQKSKITVIQNSVELNREIANPHGRDGKIKTILSVGSYEKHKQHDLLIEAFSLLENSFPEWRLNIWGRGSLKDHLVDKVKALNLNSKISICGITDNIEDEYKNAQILCHPAAHEGLPQTVAEATAHGLPVVGFKDCSGLNEIITDRVNGVLASQMTANSLADALSVVLKDKNLRNYLGKNALLSSRLFNPEYIFTKWENLLYKTAKSKHHTYLDNLPCDSFIKKLCNDAYVTNIFGATYPKAINSKTPLEVPTISVQIPVFNAERYLRQCLDSILNQTFKEFEVICVNDGSTDSSMDILKEYSDIDSRIKVFDLKKNRGTLYARKTAFENAHGKYMLFVDADDMIQPGMFKKLVGLATSSNADMIQFAAKIYDPDSRMNNELKARYDTYLSHVSNVALSDEKVVCSYNTHIRSNLWITFVSREIYKSIVPHIVMERIQHGNDNLLMLMMSFFSKKFVTSNEILYLYRASHTSANLNTPSFDCLNEQILSRSRMLHLSRLFLQNVNARSYLNYDFMKNHYLIALNYCISLYIRCLSQNPQHADALMSLIRKCFSAEFSSLEIDKNLHLELSKLNVKFSLYTRVLSNTINSLTHATKKIGSGDNASTFYWPGPLETDSINIKIPYIDSFLIVLSVNAPQQDVKTSSFQFFISGKSYATEFLCDTNPQIAYCIVSTSLKKQDILNMNIRFSINLETSFLNALEKNTLLEKFSIGTLAISPLATPNLQQFPISHFDGKAYLKEYKDVADLISKRVFVSAAQHYEIIGRKEKRRLFLAYENLPSMGYRFEIEQ